MSLFQFLHQEDKFLVIFKVWNILKTKTCSKLELNLFPNNLNALKISNNSNTQWKNIIIVCSEILFSKNSHHIESSQLTCEMLQLTGFYMIQVFSESCFWTDYKNVFVFSPLQWAHDLPWQYMNPGCIMNALCTFYLGSVSIR